MDTGAETVLLTEDHRVATHQGERRRLDAMGATIAPIDISGAARCRLGVPSCIASTPAGPPMCSLKALPLHSCDDVEDGHVVLTATRAEIVCKLDADLRAAG